MTSKRNRRDIFPLTVFYFSVGGIHYGVSADQILSAAPLDEEMEDQSLCFRREMGYADEARHRPSAVVKVISGGGKHFSVAVDSIEEIQQVTAEAIHPLPPLVARKVRSKGLWGAVLRNGKVYLLIDLLLWKKS